MAISAVMLTVAAFEYHSLEVGWSVRGLPGGMARLLFGYSVGLLIYRLHALDRLTKIAIPGWLCLVAVPIILFVPLGPIGRALHISYAERDAFTVIALFPGLLTLSLHIVFTRVEAFIASFLAVASYPLYSLHKPLKDLAQKYLIPHAHGNLQVIAFWLLFVTIAVIGSHYVGKYIEPMMQRKIRVWLARKILNSQTANASLH